MEKLDTGDIVRHVNCMEGYIVTSNYKSANTPHITAVRTVDITKPDEWIWFSKQLLRDKMTDRNITDILAHLHPLSKKDFPEDRPLENGNYLNTCCFCKCTFTGHKRRVQCKECFLSYLGNIVLVPEE